MRQHLQGALPILALDQNVWTGTLKPASDLRINYFDQNVGTCTFAPRRDPDLVWHVTTIVCVEQIGLGVGFPTVGGVDQSWCR